MGNFVDIDLSSISPVQKEVYTRRYTSSVVGDCGPLYKVMKMHYRGYRSAAHWREFCDTWLPHALGICIGYRKGSAVPASFAMWMMGSSEKEMYIRLLCSKDRCGGATLKHVLRLLRDSDIISLHSEPHTIRFYEKHGFVRTKEVLVDEHGIRYPLMVFSKEGVTGSTATAAFDIESGWHWPGIAYYLVWYWKYIVAITLFSIILL